VSESDRRAAAILGSWVGQPLTTVGPVASGLQASPAPLAGEFQDLTDPPPLRVPGRLARVSFPQIKRSDACRPRAYRSDRLVVPPRA